MKKGILVLMTVCFFGCAQQSKYVKNESLDQTKDIVIAILPFQNNSPDKTLDSVGITLSDLISAKMSTKKKFKMVERTRIEELMKEMKLSQSGMIDQGTAMQIGKMVGANVMGFGSYTVLGKNVMLTLRLVKVETGEVVGGVNERGDDISKLDILAENAAAKIANAFEPQH